MMVQKAGYAVPSLLALVLGAGLALAVPAHAQDSPDDVPIIPAVPTETPQHAAQDLVSNMGSRDLIATTRLQIALKVLALTKTASANKAAAEKRLAGSGTDFFVERLHCCFYGMKFVSNDSEQQKKIDSGQPARGPLHIFRLNSAP